eukprot:558441-Amorphochlora_amoeboformis.AAC.1
MRVRARCGSVRIRVWVRVTVRVRIRVTGLFELVVRATLTCWPFFARLRDRLEYAPRSDLASSRGESHESERKGGEIQRPRDGGRAVEEVMVRFTVRLMVRLGEPRSLGGFSWKFDQGMHMHSNA